MRLIGEVFFLFPVVAILTIISCDRLPRMRNGIALVLNALGTYALIYAAILGADVATDLIPWEDCEYDFFIWLIAGLFFQAMGFHSANTKWPVAAPNLIGIAAILVESLIHPCHWKAAAALALWTVLLTLCKRREF